MHTRDKVIVNYLLTIISCLALTGCFNTSKFTDNGWSDLKETYRVKGRADFASTHKIEFGQYRSSTARLDVTETRNRSQVPGVIPAIYPFKNPSVISFSMNANFGARSNVRCWNGALPEKYFSDWNDFTVYYPVMPIILKNPQQTIFCAEISTNEVGRWKMMIAKTTGEEVCGFLIKDDDNYYRILPIVQTGNPSVTTGYQFRNRAEQIVAAVSVSDRSAVELGHLPEDQKFLLANAAAGILMNYFLQISR